MPAASTGCTQPSSSTTRRAWRAAGHAAAVPRTALRAARHVQPRSAAGSSTAASAPACSNARTRARVWHDLAQQAALAAPGERARHALIVSARPMSSRRPYSHARRTGSLTGAAGQAAIQVQLRARRHRLTLQQLLHEINAPAGAVQLVAEQLVGRAGGQTEAAVHAAAQDGVVPPQPSGVFLRIRRAQSS